MHPNPLVMKYDGNMIVIRYVVISMFNVCNPILR